MGVDVVLMALTHKRLTDAALAALHVEYRERWAYPGDDYEGVFRERYAENDADDRIIEVHTLARYYGENYERGDWPTIKEVADWLTVRLGEMAEVRYGPDSLGFWDEITRWVDQRDTIEAHWQKCGHLPYRQYFKMSCNCDYCANLLSALAGRIDA